MNDEKGFFFDFSSGKNGDLITFLQETERLTFAEAVERLAAEAGVALPAVDPRAAEQEKCARAWPTGWSWPQWFEAELRRPPAARARAIWRSAACRRTEWAPLRHRLRAGGRARR